MLKPTDHSIAVYKQSKPGFADWYTATLRDKHEVWASGGTIAEAAFFLAQKAFGIEVVLELGPIPVTVGAQC